MGTAAAAPTNAAPPSVSDNTWQNQTLVVTQGSWTGGTVTGDEWFECDGSGANCTDTGVDATQFAIGSGHVGHTYRVTETATASDSTTATQTSAPSRPIQPSAPSKTGDPVINQSGGTTQGDPLSVQSDATWSQPPDSLTYQWDRCTAPGSCTAISGANAPTYTLTRDDAGDTIRLDEAPVYGPTTLAAVSSSEIGPVAATAPVNSSPPTISPSSATEGQQLTADPGTWSNAPTYAYQWLDCTSPTDRTSCRAVASGQQYTTTAADQGSYVRVEVTASVPGAQSTADSNATAQVEPPPPAAQSAPTISGRAEQAQTLTASTGSWSNSPTSYAYQWQDCNRSGAACHDIPGATGSSYIPTAGDVGYRILVQVTAANANPTPASATSATTAVITTSSTTTLVATPANPATNQSVTLIATVTARSAAASPDGTVRFTDGGTTISGCGDVTVTPSGQSATVVCQTTLGAGARNLAASFTASSSGIVLDSSSTAQQFAVKRASTTTSVDVSSVVKVHNATTYTATVGGSAARSGPLEPGGTLTFYDNGKALSGCVNRPVSTGGATCTTTYAKPGKHRVKARFNGDANFTSSTSPAKPVTVTALPIKGRVTATMQWTFHYTPTYTKVLALVVNGASSSTVRIHCSGKGCPFASRKQTVGRAKRCAKKGKARRTCPTPGRVGLTGSFRGRKLHVGARITVAISRSQYIGKYYSFTIRARRQPRVRIACLAVDGTKPGVGCTTRAASRRGA